MEKLNTSKTFLKMAGGKMHTPHPTPLNPPLAISYRNHQKSLAYFSHLTPLILFCFTKKQSQKGGAWPNAPHLLNTLLALSTHNRKCANKMHRIFLYSIAYLSSYHEKAINALYDLA